MIERFNNKDAYLANGKPTDETQVSLIEDSNEVFIDGVNVIKDVPQIGDAIYKDTGGNVYIVDAESLQPSLLPNTWTYQGPFLYMWDKDTMAYFNGNVSSLPTKKYADVVQFSISAISATTIKFWLKMAGDYATFVGIEATLTSAEINATTASEITAALEAAGNTGNVGYDNHKYWAYLADANGNKVDSDGTQIIVQCDEWFDYRQHQCSDGLHALVGCTMALNVWGDMPANTTYLKRNGRTTSNRGLMNIEGGALYWSTNGRTPDANVAVNSEADSTSPMSKTAFLTSSYAADIRAYYPSYEDYLKGEFGIMTPNPDWGAFALPNGKAMTDKYGPMAAVTKGGTTKAKFPALNWAYGLGNESYLWDISEGVLIMKDENLALINATQNKVGKVVISNATNRWFAERCSANYAWNFNGTNRYLINNAVPRTVQVGAVTLLKIR